MSNNATVLLSSHEGIATITLNRPDKHNAMDGPLVKTLLTTLQAVKQDETARVLMLRSNGKHFCAGGDIAWMQKIAEADEATNKEDALELANVMQAIHQFPKPVITVAQGVTLGGGAGLLACSDIVVTDATASFGFSEIKLGIAPSVISPYVIAAIGERAACYYFLTGERFDAETARKIGLVHHVVSPDTLLDVGLALAKTISTYSQQALMEIKRLIQHVMQHPLSDALTAYTAEHLASMRLSPDAKEGLQAFLEKRAPHWS